MTDVPEGATAQLVGDIVAAIRIELSDRIPVLLAPLVEEVKDLKNQSSSEKDGGCDKHRAPSLELTAISDLPSFDELVRKRSNSWPSAMTQPGLAAVAEKQPSELPSNGDATAGSARARSQSLPWLGAPAVAAAAAAARAAEEAPLISPDELISARSEFWVPSGDASRNGSREMHSQENHKSDFEDTPVEKQRGRVTIRQSLPMEIEFETELSQPLVDSNTPLVDPAGPPEVGPEPRESLFQLLWRHVCGQQRTSARSGYHPTPQHDTNEDETEPGDDSILLEVDIDDDEAAEFMDPEAARRLPKEIADLETKETGFQEEMHDLDALWKNRRFPYEEDVRLVREEIEKLQEELEQARMPRNQEPPPSGPIALKFVGSEAFAAVCNLIVLLNLVSMILAPKFKNYAETFKVLDQMFLAWYVLELSTKAIYYQRSLLFGKISIVWWNWLDTGIVVSGIVDQWLLPLLALMEGGHLDIDTSALRMLRLLRLFRIMRFLKIIRAFLKSDFAWTEGAAFEIWMAGVIAFNSVVMSLELDVPWAGWLYVENFLQIVYTFELALRLKRQCCDFFLDADNFVWNYLDFIMVVGGALDLWFVPLIFLLKGMFAGTHSHNHSSTFSGFLKVLRIMRILRVLRLVRLLKMVKPLYRLLIGVIASVKAMQWVMVLTFLTLYACSIVFTNLVGKGLMSDGVVSDLALQYFGSVTKSLFSLFKLMNGEMSVVEPITGSVMGQLLFACFMVVSNWAILAILTAVVSDNMITTSQKANEEDETRKNEFDHQKRIRRLTALFKEIDRDGEGSISTIEWQRMMEDRTLSHELCDATGLHTEDLNDYFECLAKDPEQEERVKRTTTTFMSELNLDYSTFIEALKDEGVLADKRSILHVMKQLRILERQLKTEFEELGKFRRWSMRHGGSGHSFFDSSPT